MQMPNPLAEPGKSEYYQTVPVLSHEFLAMVNTMVTMSPWFSWRTAPGCQRSGVKLGPMDKAQEWYDAKLLWYRSFYGRNFVTQAGDGLLEKESDFLLHGMPISLEQGPGGQGNEHHRGSQESLGPAEAIRTPLDTPIQD